MDPLRPEGPSITAQPPKETSTSTPSSPTLRRDSVRPRTPSTTATKTLLTALNLLILSIAALRKAGETPQCARTPERAATIGKLLVFIREAWSEETFAVELRKAERQVPTVGAVDAAEMCVGVWLWEAVGMLRRGGLGRDADDLEAICAELKGEPAMATGTTRRMKVETEAGPKNRE